MSLLSIVQNVAAAVNTTIPGAIIGSSSADAVQWLALANRVGKELYRRHDWQSLLRVHTWTTTATEFQVDGIPTNFDHFVPDVELWDQTNNVPLTGPVSSNSWIAKSSSGVIGGPGWWRVQEGIMQILPAPSAGLTFAYEFISTNWVDSADHSTGKSVWEVDTDVGNISEELIELGLTWRWLRAHGMDYAEELSTYEREVEKAAARDRGLGVIEVGRRHNDSASWPGTIIP